MKIFINGEQFTLTLATRHPTWASVTLEGTDYIVPDKEKLLRLTEINGTTMLKFRWPDDRRSLPHEFTIIDRVWTYKRDGEYRRKQEPTLPFPHAGQVVSLDGVEIEVCHVTASGVVFWHNPEDGIYGVIRVEKLRPSLIETMRADLAKGLAPKELIALGWSRKC
jgi:hypothetical protein